MCEGGSAAWRVGGGLETGMNEGESQMGKNLSFKGAVRLRIFMAIFPCMTAGMLYLHYEKVEIEIH